MSSNTSMQIALNTHRVQRTPENNANLVKIPLAPKRIKRVLDENLDPNMLVNVYDASCRRRLF